MSSASFAGLVSEAMARRGLGLRELCRRARLDPSLLSKVLAGKRNPPTDDETLERLAQALEFDPIALSVSAGRVPASWRALASDPELLATVSRLAGRAAPRRSAAPSPAAAPVRRPTNPSPLKPFNEELL